MRRISVTATVLALALTASACGLGQTSDGGDGLGQATATVSDAEAGALLGSTTAGETIVGADGRSLYGFTNDIDALSTCYGTCADAWPPVIVGPDWTVGPGLDAGIFATTVRDDGQLQLVAGKWPLYHYTGDAVPGDITGQGSGDVWFLIDPAGSLITDPVSGDNGAEDVVVEGY